MNDTLNGRGPRRTARRGGGATGALVVLVLLAAVAALPAAGGAASPPAPVDLNSAPLEAVLALPLPPEVAKAIVNHRTYIGFFGDVFDVLEVEGMTPALFAAIKPLVSTMPPPEDDATLARLSASYRQVRQYMSQEGSNEGIADEYLDRMRTPENLNDLDLFDLMSYQNVSPVDATNILKARDRLGRFESQRQLSGTDGLRYFAYRNLRDFVVYSDEEKADYEKRLLTGYVQTRYTETPPADEDDELSSYAFVPRGKYYVAELPIPKAAWYNKIRVNGQRGFTAGVLTNREYGEQNWDETVKAFAGVRDRSFGDFRLKGFYVGNYRAAFGLGLVMDNTDYIQYRKTGYGFNKRVLGISGDVSRSYEYHLQGAAFEGSWKRLHLAAFWSTAEKDAVLNPDGSINRFVRMEPRLDADSLLVRTVEETAGSGVFNPSYLRRKAVEENLLGANLKVMLAPGTYVGVSGYEARYNRGFRPDASTLIIDQSRLEARDREIWDSYNSFVTNPDGTVTENKWRRVMGAEAQGVYGNVAVQGEYAFLQDPRYSLFNTKNPDALVVNTFAQWDNLHLLGIWRDYDVGFDNPYNRAFSNDNRYEMTLLDAPYRLKDDLYAWLESTTPQPKPEKGLFLEARYRISRQLTITGLQFDQWERKADGADLMRYTMKAEYQPIFNLRFRVRHRYSSRSEQNPDDVRAFRNWETRWQVIALLSNYNRLGFMYSTSNVFFPARQRLSGTADGDPNSESAVGTAAAPGHAFEARYEHNLTPGIKLTFASLVYDGFLWNFEGDDFVLLDGKGFRNWFKVESRVSERLLFQLKVTRDHNLPKTYVDIRDFGGVVGTTPDATRVAKDDTFIRLQMDYTF